MLDVHLFFVKMFGCIIAEHNIPINLAEFSNALLRREAHPNLWLGFGVLKRWNKNKAIITPIKALNANESIEFANWHYMLRKVFVDIVFSQHRKYLQVANDAWHPKISSKILHLTKLRVNHQVRME
jgi:hypothetical protein